MMAGIADNVLINSRLALLFVKTAMIYLVVGSVLMALSVANVLPIGHDPLFIMELYGFVTMMIFGLSYIFVPGLTHSGFISFKLIRAEFALMNIGVILIVITMLHLAPTGAAVVAAPSGFGALIIAVLIHAVNIIRMRHKSIAKPPEAGQQDVKAQQP